MVRQSCSADLNYDTQKGLCVCSGGGRVIKMSEKCANLCEKSKKKVAGVLVLMMGLAAF